MIALSEDDLVCFNDEVLSSMPDVKTSPKSEVGKATARIVVDNITEDQALQINGPIGKKGWREVSQLEIRNNRAIGRSMQVNHGTSMEVFKSLMNARASDMIR